MNEIKPTKKVFDWRHAIQLSGLKPTTRLVLFNLSCHMNIQGESCYPSIETQAEETGLSKRAISEHIQLAIEAGFLVKIYKKFDNSKWKHNEYRAVFPHEFDLLRAEDFQSEVGAPPAPSENLVDDPNCKKWVHQGNTNSSLNTSLKKERKKYIKKFLTLEQWEEDNSTLCESMMSTWIKDKGLDPKLVKQQIDDFRTEMIGKGKQYTNFVAVFQTYLNKGYLTKRIEQLKLSDRPVQPSHTQVFNRGGMI